MAEPLWKVTGMIPQMEMGAGRIPVEGFRIEFVTDQGVQGHVFVSRDQIGNQQMVANAINNMVTNMHNITGLTG